MGIIWVKDMTSHPYKSSPWYARWSKAVAGVTKSELNPSVNFPFTLNQSDKIGTAGSCFAQHIARRLKAEGFNYFVTEPGHTLFSPSVQSKFNYGLFSARYANIYTVEQLLQLFERAFDGRITLEDHWVLEDGSYVDPLRPTIEPNGYASLKELRLDREQHLAAVRKLFCELDYFIFTLGLTEAWVSKEDGTVFPVCPGVAGGNFSAEKYYLKNFSVSEVVTSLDAVISKILTVNPSAKFIFTVSPVPLVATAENEHVLVSTTYSKSVLRVSCTEIVNKHPERTAYFPSYEIITGAYNRGSYFAEDLRNVTDEGVDHVMKIFMGATTTSSLIVNSREQEAPNQIDLVALMQERQRVVCEEELLELGPDH